MDGIVMAKFRMVHTEFWDDPTVIEEFTPEDKYFLLYLLTNSNTTQVGIYEITKKQMAFDMGYSMETINSLLDRFLKHHELVKYNPETREIAIKNWGKYNLRRGGKPMLDCVRSELSDVKDKTLIEYVGERVENNSIKDLYDTYTIRTTYRPQEEDKEEEEDKEKEEEQEQQEEVAEIIQFWDNNGFGFNNVNAKQSLLSWLDDSKFDKPSEMIIKAMEIACEQNKRNLGYVQGILRNWTNESILTLGDIQERPKQTSKSEFHYDPAVDSF